MNVTAFNINIGYFIAGDRVQLICHCARSLLMLGLIAGPALAVSVEAAESDSADSPHWAFQPLVRPDLPDVQQSQWVRTSVDAFVLAGLEANNLSPAPEAEPHLLLRRLWANLVGLPPSREAVAQYITGAAPGAYERQVEQLLNSPHYGERWGRHWLDVVRFAESTGFVENRVKPHFWRYRDWVVDSFNDDKPYDTFIVQQIAGDEIEPYADENIIATGFLASARLASEELSCVRQEDDMYVDMVNATSSAVLGLTMACAQCHDHRFDPLTQRDYYQLRAFFARGYPGDVLLGGAAIPEEAHKAAANFHETNHKIRTRVLQEGVDEGSDELKRLWTTSPADRTPTEEAEYRVERAALNIRIAGCNAFRIKEEEKAELAAAKATIDAFLPKLSQTWAFYSPVTSPHALSTLLMEGNFPLIHDRDALSQRVAYLHTRGDPYRPAEVVTPQFPQVLRQDLSEDIEPDGDTTAARELSRLDLAKWMTQRDSVAGHLTARVWANRIWHYHFGRGLVTTPGNFGTRGAAPTHPELLDHLASELIDSGWSTKHVQRLIVNSSTYRQSARAEAGSTDPENKFFGRWPMRRLESEVLRDMLLSVAGQLDRSVGGPSVASGAPTVRRSLYQLQRRDLPDELTALFDGPTTISESCAQRHVSTSALQPLFLLNSPQVTAWANALADTVRSQAPDDLRQQVALVFRSVLVREPTSEEQAESLAYLGSPMSEPNAADLPARIERIDFRADSQQPLPTGVVRASLVAAHPGPVGHYVLHRVGYANHTPEPAASTVTYFFDQRVTVRSLELVVHQNGISRMEGFVGNAVDDLRSIGEATNDAAAKEKQFPAEQGHHEFRFERGRCRPGRVFQFIVRETVLETGYANYQAYPIGDDGERIPPTTDLVPDAPRAMDPLARFCQAIMNLNEFLYVP